MIKDKLVNAGYYNIISNRFKKAFEWLKNTDIESLEDGKYVIDGEILYANVQTYKTKDNADFEAHRNYIDVQYMVKGCEVIETTDYKDCRVLYEYDVEKDIEFLKSDVKPSLQILKQGEFLILLPGEVHKPSLKLFEQSSVKKIVVKIAV